MGGAGCPVSVGPGVLALGSAGGQGWLLTWLALRSGVFQGCYIAGGLAEGSRVSWSLGQPAGGGVGALCVCGEEAGVIWELCYFLHNFAVMLKLLKKNKSIKKADRILCYFPQSTEGLVCGK